jgi:diaminopimelate epimerase
LGGPIEAELFGDNAAQLDVRVEMGQATINPDVRSLEVEGRLFPVSAVSVGNPHAVYISPDARLEDLLRWGPHIETHPAFPNRTNVQFVRVLSRSEIQVFVWERGAGHTQSSGSSACAAVFACFDRGLVDTAVTVQLEGGALQIEVRPPNQIIMSGPVEETCVLRLAENLRRRLLAQ